LIRSEAHTSSGDASAALGFVCATPLEQGIQEIQQAIESGRVHNYRDKMFSNYEYLLEAGNEVLKSEPNVQLFGVLEPADIPAATTPPKVYAAGAAS
jgi:hypothetical protein